MIVVISDLHFEEEASDVIWGPDGYPALIFRRNLHAKAYRSFIDAMAEEVRRRHVRDFELVIAGDLFDFNRTVLWFEDELRPYVSLSEIAPPLDSKLLRILEAIAAEPPVRDALECLQRLTQGSYQSLSNDPADTQKLDFPAENIAIHYLTGNHDRLANATAGARRRIRELLGLQGEARFDHSILFRDPAVLVRHGHEYDPDNFGIARTGKPTVPSELPEDAYSLPTFGDFITIDIAARLPYLFRKQYRDGTIVQDKLLSELYLRLLQFDDVRPQSALLDYLLDSSGSSFSEEQAWELLVPVLEVLLNELHRNRYFLGWLKQRAHSWTPGLLKVSRGLLRMGLWQNRAARQLARHLSHHFLTGDKERPELLAGREEVIQNRAARLVVAGHTHSPQVSLVASDAEADRFYVNTGTWRNRIPATPDRRTFGRLKALTYVMLFAANEDAEGTGPHFGSFDYWTGYTRHWAGGN